MSAARPVNDRVAIVGEVGDARSRVDEFYPYVEEEQWYTFAGGVRFVWRRPRVTTFVDGLVGAAIGEQRFYHPPGFSSHDERFSLIQYGGGGDIRITQRVAARVTAKVLLLVSGAGETVGLLRFTAGVVVGIGRR